MVFSASVRRLRQALQAQPGRDAGRRQRAGRREPEEEESHGLRPLEGLQARRACLGKSMGRGAPRVAHRVLGDGVGGARRRARHPWRWHRPVFPASRQ